MVGIVKHRALVAMFLVLGASLTGLSLLPSASAATLYVGGAGPGNYTTIQAAIDAANPGDTVYVYSGTYYEALEITKTMSLKGENRDTTIIDRSSPGDVIQVSADWVNISGFTVMNSAHEIVDSGVRLASADHCHLSGNNFSRSYYGIYLDESRSTTIADNVFWNDTTYGIRFYWSDDNIFVNNTSPEVRWPPTVWVFNSARNLISDNHFLDYFLWAAHDNIITNNTAGSVSVWFTSRTTIAGNLITRGAFAYGGIYLDNSTDNTIRGNTILAGNYIWFKLHNSRDNLIYHNNIEIVAEESHDWMHVYLPSHNIWDNGYPSGGNYWKHYRGEDRFSGPDQDLPGGDGFGDEPHTILIYGPNGSVDQDYDRYPLMEPYVPPPAPPSAPVGLNATQVGMAVVMLKWKPPLFDGGSPITNYIIYRGLAPGAEMYLTEVGNVTEYMDAGLETGRTYYYNVAARNAIGEGTKSNEASATVSFAARPPADNVRVPWTDISLNWTNPLPPIPGGDSGTSERFRYPESARSAG